MDKTENRKLSAKRPCALVPNVWALGLLFCAGVWSGLLLGQAEAREVRVGIYENEPKVFTDGGGQPAGIFVDLLQAIAQKEDWQPSYIHCEWNDCLKQLAEGRIDLLPDVALTPERNLVLDFHHTPALHSWSQLYSPLGTTLDSIPELGNRRIAVLQGSIQE
ncbi:MAG: hypothetical protein Fur0026_08290 [Sideroxydans sp.]